MEWEMTPDAKEEFAELPKVEKTRVLKKIRWMADNWPQTRGEPLDRELKGLEKRVTGNYRIIYSVAGTKIWIVKIGDRKDVYGHGN